MFEKAEQLSNFLWTTSYKTKRKFFEDFHKHRESLKKLYDPEEYFLILIGRKYNSQMIFTISSNSSCLRCGKWDS